MADIEIVYRVCRCKMRQYDIVSEYCTMQDAENTACRYYHKASDGNCDPYQNFVPYGDCEHAYFDYVYKGLSGKRYEMVEDENVFEPHLDCMLVQFGKKVYKCEKVTLNGECIYNHYDSESPEEDTDE